MMLPRHRALAILDECTGDHIWSLEHCRARGVPSQWIDALGDAYESGFKTDAQTIYTDHGVVNQYQGVRDFDLAIHSGRALGVNVESILTRYPSRLAIVAAIKQAVSDDE